MRKTTFRFLLAGVLLTSITAGACPEDGPVQRPGRKTSLTAKQVFERSKNAVVRVETDKGAGTGFFIGDGWFVATCYHVIKDAKTLRVTDATGKSYKIAKVGVNKEDDAAVLMLHEQGPAHLNLATTNSISPGDTLYVIGNPLGFLTHTITSGILSAKRVSGNTKLLQITAPISPGSSGSPIIDQRGYVVGFASFTFTRGQSLNMGVANKSLGDIVKKGFRTTEKFLSDNGLESNSRLAMPPSTTLPSKVFEEPPSHSTSDTKAAERFMAAFVSYVGDVGKELLAWELELYSGEPIGSESATRRINAVTLRKNSFNSAVRRYDSFTEHTGAYDINTFFDTVKALRNAASDRYKAELDYIGLAFERSTELREAVSARFMAESQRTRSAYIKLLMVVKNQPWFNLHKFQDSMPAPVLGALFVNLKDVWPDPIFTSKAVIRYAYPSSQFKAGDQITGIRLDSETSFTPVGTWIDVTRILQQEKNSVFDVQIERAGSQIEVQGQTR